MLRKFRKMCLNQKLSNQKEDKMKKNSRKQEWGQWLLQNLSRKMSCLQYLGPLHLVSICHMSRIIKLSLIFSCERARRALFCFTLWLCDRHSWILLPTANFRTASYSPNCRLFLPWLEVQQCHQKKIDLFPKQHKVVFIYENWDNFIEIVLLYQWKFTNAIKTQWSRWMKAVEKRDE